MDDMQTLDWKKLENFIKTRKPVEVSAGILNDWFWTAATVYENGKWKDRNAAYVTSYWATPGFKATLKNGDVIEVVASVKETPAQAKKRKAKAERSRKALHKMADKIRADRERSPQSR